jgi:dimethylglycine oxidase
VEARAVIDRVWPGRGAHAEPLGGGITNHNFKVVVDGEAFVLRIGGQGTGGSGSTAGWSSGPRSGRWGGSTGSRSIAYAYLPAAAVEPGRSVEVEIFGEWVPGEVAAEPLFDPAGERVRA